MQVKGKQVRLGIKAGPDTPVHREEVYNRIQEENIRAAKLAPSKLPSAHLMKPKSESADD